MPLIATTLLLVNPEPEMVRGDAAEPAGKLVGLMELIAGVVVPPPPLLLEEPPEHPASDPTRLRIKEKAKRRDDTTGERRDAKRSTYDRLSIQLGWIGRTLKYKKPRYYRRMNFAIRCRHCSAFMQSRVLRLVSN